jgi:hypothetical protein
MIVPPYARLLSQSSQGPHGILSEKVLQHIPAFADAYPQVE